jgi:hypothetical protein
MLDQLKHYREGGEALNGLQFDDDAKVLHVVVECKQKAMNHYSYDCKNMKADEVPKVVNS